MRENGKIEDSVGVYESQILRLAAVGGARRHRNHEVGNRQLLRASRDTYRWVQMSMGLQEHR